MKSLIYCIIFAIAACFSNVCAQNDIGMWIGLGTKYSVNKKIDVSLEAESRFDNHVSRNYNSFVSPGINYTPVKHVRLGADYRLSAIPYNSGTRNLVAAHRYTADVEFRKILELLGADSRLELSMRLRGTTRFEKEKRNDSYLRYRIKAEYNLPKTKLEPELLFEWFYHLNDDVVYTFESVTTSHRFDKFRIRLGAAYPLKKRHSLKVFTIYHRLFGSDKNEVIFGAGYSYSLKFKK